MLLQKTFHLGQSIEDCQAGLASTIEFSFRGPLGFQAHTVLRGIDSESPTELAFESVGGDIEVMGLAEFAEVRPNVTEITLAVHYEINNKAFASLDQRLGIVDAFLNSELRRLRSHSERITVPSVWPTPSFALLEPVAA